MLKACGEFSPKLEQSRSMFQYGKMQYLVRAIAFVLVIVLAAAGAVFDAQTSAEVSTPLQGDPELTDR